ncbi:DUF4430 domain-containing protein [Metabacillus litoralis]|uniref:DUF4430 domain-containing protein n=1 Tax=Metabacillus litoralis TaxID=152268 RepID=UPI00203BBB19|nr:DUF4430 domain-containing protein [Metabacillus litoralis]MCM3161272.1 DUF4430 domain-containing protein [Metabacillus litoralis]
MKTFLLIVFSTILFFTAACEKDEVSPVLNEEASEETQSNDKSDQEAEQLADSTKEVESEDKQEVQTEEKTTEETTAVVKEDKKEETKEPSSTSSQSKSSNTTTSTTNTSEKKETEKVQSTTQKTETTTKKATNESTRQDTTTATKEQSTTPPPKKEEPKPTVTISIVGDIEKGTILPATKVVMSEGNTVLDVTLTILKQKGIPVSVTGSGSSAYVEGIDNLFEFDRGQFSGWTVKRNGSTLNRSAGVIAVTNGDTVQWIYTTNYNED